MFAKVSVFVCMDERVNTQTSVQKEISVQKNYNKKSQTSSQL